MSYKALDVTQYIVKKCNKLKVCINNLKLQKILYFVQAEFLVTKNQPCFDDEIQAWDFGPVVPSVYFRYKMFGSSNIPCVEKKDISNKISKQDKEMIDDVINHCIKYSTATLTDITLNQTPWLEIYNKSKQNVIPCENIKHFFISEKEYTENEQCIE